MIIAKLINDICLVSREGVCLLDMRQVAEKASQLGLSSLAELAERERENSNGGKYYQALKTLYGEQS